MIMARKTSLSVFCSKFTKKTRPTTETSLLAVLVIHHTIGIAGGVSR